jgi:hypothetical protein
MGAGVVCCAQPATVRRRKTGKEVAGNFIEEVQEPRRKSESEYLIKVTQRCATLHSRAVRRPACP